MVQEGGLEPPTSGSTDQRSNQLSYSCTSQDLHISRLHYRDCAGKLGAKAGLGKARPFTPCGPLQLGRAGSAIGSCLPSGTKKPGPDGPGLAVLRPFGSDRRLSARSWARSAQCNQATFLKALLTLSLIGSTVSVVTFWASALSSLVCALSASNCLRACEV